MTANRQIENLCARLGTGERLPVYLVTGDLVVSEPAALELAQALVGEEGQFETHRRPAKLSALLNDLQTFSLFQSLKVVVAIDTAVVADRKSAAALVGEALKVAPPAGEGLAGAERSGASRLLQALFLFGIEPNSGSEESVLSELPDWALAGAKGGRVGKVQAKSRREALSVLLGAARREGLVGIGDEGVAQLDDVVRRGLPEGHALILVERGVDLEHPLVVRLRTLGGVVELASVRSEKRGGWSGVEPLIAQLESELGVGIHRDALQELLRRTLKAESSRQGEGAASSDSTARLAGEYRKLAELTAGSDISKELVERVVVDRGEEDVWKLLDAVGEGRVGEALVRLDRLLAAADDPSSARFSFFSLLAGFCRQLTLVRGIAEAVGVRGGERNYRTFKDRVVPRLTAELPGGGRNPLAGQHPYRLHRAYLAAFRLSPKIVCRLPEWTLETELALKGESAEPRAALAGLLGRFG